LLFSLCSVKEYLDALEHASLTDDLARFQTFMHKRLDATLGEYVSTLQEAQPVVADSLLWD
jgi:hypothetical protein